MKNRFINLESAAKTVFVFGLLFVLPPILRTELNAQKKPSKVISQTSKNKSKNKTSEKNFAPKVVRIDAFALKKLVSRNRANAKPLLVNFWATWCVPCREEFPELVKINDDYKNKIDFITVSLDDLAEIKRDVPKFLAEMKAEAMPAYLLKTPDEQTAIASISKDYKGTLPLTILLDGAGEIAFLKSGKVDALVLRGEIDKILPHETVK